MSTLTLVRHGQATPFEKVTDRLSETGVRQAKELGSFWKKQGTKFDEVVCGTLERHKQTLEYLHNYARQNPDRQGGGDFPKNALVASGLAQPVRFDAGWNEYRADEIIARLSPVLEAQDERYARLAAASREAMQGPDRNRHFQKMLEALMSAWLRGATAAGIESFAAFEARVLEALRTVIEGSSGRDIVVITSGGPIGMCVRHALSAPAEAFLDVNWRMRNTGITEFTFSSSRFTLDSVNGLPHLLEHRDLWTWR